MRTDQDVRQAFVTQVYVPYLTVSPLPSTLVPSTTLFPGDFFQMLIARSSFTLHNAPGYSNQDLMFTIQPPKGWVSLSLSADGQTLILSGTPSAADIGQTGLLLFAKIPNIALSEAYALGVKVTPPTPSRSPTASASNTVLPTDSPTQLVWREIKVNGARRKKQRADLGYS
eukprot:g66523.t1